MANDNELLLIDLSSIAHPLWHMSQNEPDPNHTSTQTVARVRALASAHPHAAVCCDSGRSFRRDVDPTYKANRPESLAPLQHQITLAMETLRADGFPVWAVKGMEADDIIATATARVLAMDGSVLIVSADKDLLQLVGPHVTAKSLKDGSVIDEDAVFAKFGVKPAQMRDYLSLVGDSSDNIVGAKGIGPKRAAELLALFGSIDDIYAAIDAGTGVFPPAVRNSLVEFRDRLATVRALVTMRTDVEIPFEEIAAERVARPLTAASMAVEGEPEDDDWPVRTTVEEQRAHTGPIMVGTPETAAALSAAVQRAQQAEPARVLDMPAQPARVPAAAPDDTRPPINVGAVALREQPAPAEFERALEPRSMPQAMTLANHMYESRLFSSYGSAQGILATVLAGRELGLPAMASLRAFHILEGRPTLSAGTIQSLVIRSGLAKYFRCTERTAERATFETQRGDDPPMSLTFTVVEGRQAFAGDDKAFAKSGWGRNPADMCVARASSKLARLVYPDVVSGLYAPEEFD